MRGEERAAPGLEADGPRVLARGGGQDSAHDAAAHVDSARAKLYDELVNAIDAVPGDPGQPSSGLVGQRAAQADGSPV